MAVERGASVFERGSTGRARLATAALCGAVLVALAGGAPSTSGATTMNFTSGPPKHTVVIPPGVYWVRARLWGGLGGDAGNRSDRIETKLRPKNNAGARVGRHSLGGFVGVMVPVTPGQVLAIAVGGDATGRDGGWNGGGRGGSGNADLFDGSGGGGRTEVRVAGRRVAVAAGGGGGGGGATAGRAGGWGADGVFPGVQFESGQFRPNLLPNPFSLVGSRLGEPGDGDPVAQCFGGGGGLTATDTGDGAGGRPGLLPVVKSLDLKTVCDVVGDLGTGGDGNVKGGGGADAIALGTSGAGGGGGGGVFGGGGGGGGQAGQGGGGGGGGMGGIADGVVPLRIAQQIDVPSPAGGSGFGRLSWKKDRIAPAVVFVTPADGARVELDSPVTLDFRCQDEQFGSGVRSCKTKRGARPGAPLDTSTVGDHLLRVRAIDRAGNAAVRTITYTVVPPTLPEP